MKFIRSRASGLGVKFRTLPPAEIEIGGLFAKIAKTEALDIHRDVSAR